VGRLVLGSSGWLRGHVTRSVIASGRLCALLLVVGGLGGCPDGPGTVGTSVCLRCHDGRLAPDRSGFVMSAHLGIGCETCHGPGLMHVRNGGRGGLFIRALENDGDVYALCRKCHEAETKGHMESGHGASGAVACKDCHDVHGGDRTVARYTDNSLCLECHGPYGFATDAEVRAHTHHSVDPAGTGASRCAACHMVPLERLNPFDGPHSHTMRPVPPIASNVAAEEGVTPTPANSCSGIAGCHDGGVATAPVFDVELREHNELLQILYDTRYGTVGEG